MATQDDMNIDEQEDGSAVVDMPEMETEEQEDGSAIVTIPSSGPEENPDFYANMSEDYDEGELRTIAMRYMDLVKNDKEARELRDKQYEEGLKRTGMGNDAPGRSEEHTSELQSR